MGDIQSCLEETFETPFQESDIRSAIDQIRQRYQENDFAFEIVAISGGYQFMTKGAYHKSIGTLLKQTTKKQLSRAALETLSIVAYKQPVTKTEMEKIRGVSCDYALQKLLEKELVDITGRSEGPGRPLLYATSEKFMDYFGLESIKDLPKPKDFKIPENMVGEAAPIEESMLVEVTESHGGIQIGNLNAAPIIVLDQHGGELVIEPLSPIMENAVNVVAAGVGLVDDGHAEPPQRVIRTAAGGGNDVSDNEPALPSANPMMDTIVDTLIAGAGIFDVAKKEVPMIPKAALRAMEEGEEE